METFFIKNIAPAVRPHGKEAFLRSLRPGERMLDVGCGNNSPMRAKVLTSGVHYTGLDVGNYNQRQQSIQIADKYVVVPKDAFASTIETYIDVFDAVVSSHNIEHCEQPDRVLTAISRSLKCQGRLYLSFPSEASAQLPRRKRSTLNFFDDPTHIRLPQLDSVLENISRNDLEVEFLATRHRPLLPLICGLALEPLSFLIGRAMPFGTTWALYGFETVIWARRR